MGMPPPKRRVSSTKRRMASSETALRYGSYATAFLHARTSSGYVFPSRVLEQCFHIISMRTVSSQFGSEESREGRNVSPIRIWGYGQNSCIDVESFCACTH